MKKYPIVLFLLIASALQVFGQAKQPCIVLQYNQKRAKTPLSGVMVHAKGSNNATTPEDGKITLSFHTLKPGDRVLHVTSTKDGYEIFNTDMVNNWIIARDGKPFELVMVKSDYLTQYKANLTQVSQDSYRKKLKQKEQELEKLKKDGQLKEEEYQKKYDELYDEYYEKLNNINNYIDQFARIDMSEVTDVEQRIIELVEHGKIEEAIRVYDSLDLTKKITAEANDILELSKAIKSAEELSLQKKDNINELYESVKKKVSLKLMADKRREARKDISSVLEVFYKLYKENPESYRPQIADLQFQLGELSSRYEAAPYFDSALSNYLILCKKESERYSTSVVKAKIEVAKSKQYFNDYSGAEVLLFEVLDYYINHDSIQFQESIASTHHLLGSLYANWPEKKALAESHYDAALKTYTDLTLQDSNSYLVTIASLKAEYGSYLNDLWQKDKFIKAEKQLSDAITDYQILVKSNPEYLKALEIHQAKLGTHYYFLWLKYKTDDSYSKAEECFKAAHTTALNEKITFSNLNPEENILEHLIKLYIEKDESEKIDEFISKYSNRLSLLSDIAYIYLENGKPEKALPLFEKIIYFEMANPEKNWLSEKAWSFLDLALCHFELNDTSKMDEALMEGFKQLDSEFRKLTKNDTLDSQLLSLIVIRKEIQKIKLINMMRAFELKTKKKLKVSTYYIKLQEYYTQFLMRNFPTQYEKIAIAQEDLGYIYRDAKKYKDAEQSYLNALKNYELQKSSQPKLFDDYAEVAKIYDDLGNLYNYHFSTVETEKAEECYIRALQQYAIAEEFDYDTSEVFYPQLHETTLDKFRFKAEIALVQLHLADLYYYTKNYGRTDTLLNKAYQNYTLFFKTHPQEDYSIVQHSKVADMFYLETFTLRNLSRMDEYDRYLQKTIEEFEFLYKVKPLTSYQSKLSELLFYQAIRYAELGKADKADSVLLRCKEIGTISNSSLSYGYNSVAYSYAKNKQYKDALKTIDKAIAANPDDANLYDSKGEILLMKGDKKKALKMWQKVLEMEPDFLKNQGGSTELYRQLQEKGMITD